MGFEVGRTFVLDFGKEGETDAYGAEVKVRSMSIATDLEWWEADARREAEIMAEHIVSWNLERDGQPIPITADGILSLDRPMVQIIAVEWVRATRGLSAPFDRRSRNGGPSPEAVPTEQFVMMDPQ